MKIKTAELIGSALDWAVAKGVGKGGVINRPDLLKRGFRPLAYSTDWSIAGPIIEREEIGLKRNAPCSEGREWEASPSILAKGAGVKFGYGPTPLVAAMRCYVASKFGDEVEIPEELA